MQRYHPAMGGKSGLKTVLWLILGVALGFGLGLLTRREARPQPLVMSVKEVLVSTHPPTEVAAPIVAVGTTIQSPPVSGLQRLKELCSDPRNLDLAECLMLVKRLAAEDCRGAIDLFRQLPRDERRLLERAA